MEIFSYDIRIYFYVKTATNWPGHDSGFAGDVQFSPSVEFAAGKGKKRSVVKKGVQRERSSCGGEGRRGNAPSHTVFRCSEI